MFAVVQRLDWSILHSLVTFVQQHPPLPSVVYFLAEILIYGMGLSLYVLWHYPEPASRHQGNKKAVIMAVISVVIALAAKSIISFVVTRERPFVTHPDLLAQNLHVDPQSFPSGHSLVAFAIACSLLYSKAYKLGTVLLICAFLVAFGRVAAGVHYPTDVIAGAVIGLLAAHYVHREASSLKQYLPNQ